jgi:hypothetical protein
MLVYSANWRAGTSESDGSADQYTQSSFTLTQTAGDSMSFRFYGTSIGVFGAKRSNHGNYEVQIDGTSYPTFNGQSPAAEFNQSLFSSNMDLGLHNLTIINEGSTFIDVDYVTFGTNIGNDDEDLIVNTFQDTHPSFTYTPPSAWTTPAMVGTFQGGSGHATSQPSAKGTLTFQGDAIALYGPVGPNSTLAYSVQVDNGSPSLYSANKQFYRSQQMLFYAGNLGVGQHSLQIQLGSTASGEFAIDYANVYTTPSLGGSFLGVSPASTSNHLPPGTVAALAITTTLAILASLLCIYLFWRQRFELLHYSPETPSKSKKSFEIPAVVQPFVLSSAMERSLGSEGHTGPSEAPSQLSSQLPRTSIYNSTFHAPLSTVRPPSEGMSSNSGYYGSSVQAAGVLTLVNAEGETGYRGAEKAGDLSQQRFDQPSGGHHPPPEYSQNPNGILV